MKNSSKALNNVLALVILVFTVTFSATQAQAAEGKKEAPVEIKYLGTFDGKPLFQINLTNEDSREMYLTLSDEHGNMIYSDIVKDKTYARKIQFDGAELNDLKLTLTLRSKKDFQTQSFQINKSTRTVENIAVEKVK